jgi:hypothetical protein
MSWVRDTLAIYGRVARRAVDLSVKHWWLGLVLVAYVAVFFGLVVVVSQLRLQLVGGFLLVLARAALVSSALVLLGSVVRDGRAVLAEIPGSFLVYLGEVVTFFFLLWALQYIALIAFAEAELVAIVFEFAVLVFLSAVPEQIYLGRESGAAVFVESYKFVGQYWVEWLPATALLIGLAYAAARFVPFPLDVVAVGVAITFAFIARGLLFLELTTSSRRAREFRRRAMG